MPTEPNVIDSPRDYRLHLMHRKALHWKTAKMSSKTAQAQDEKDHKKHIQLESHLTAGDYIFVERPRLVTIAANFMAFKRYFKLLPRHAGPYRVISVGAEYAEIDQHDTRNTVSINKISRVASEEMRNMEVRSDSRTNTDTSPAQKCQSRTIRTSTPRRKLSDTTTDLTIHTVLFDGMGKTPARYGRKRWARPLPFVEGILARATKESKLT